MTSVATITRQITASLGYPDTGYASLSAQQQADVTNAVARYIVSRPDEFTPAQVANAQRVIDKGGAQGPIEYTFGQAAKDFAGEALNQAVSINEAVNPFSESNRGSLLTRITIVAAVAAVLYFAGPKLIEAARKTLPKQ